MNAIGNVSTLNLGSCCQITDVSVLPRVSAFSNVSSPDVSALPRVHTLNLSLCAEISELTRIPPINAKLTSLKRKKSSLEDGG